LLLIIILKKKLGLSQLRDKMLAFFIHDT